jgi:hypothetical protein
MNLGIKIFLALFRFTVATNAAPTSLFEGKTLEGCRAR